MAEYIDRDTVLDIVKRTSGDYATAWCEISKLSAADVAPVKYGSWVYDPNGMDWDLGAWICSECGCKNDNLGMDNRIKPLLFEGSKYCPNCGAKMDLGE